MGLLAIARDPLGLHDPNMGLLAIARDPLGITIVIPLGGTCKAKQTLGYALRILVCYFFAARFKQA